jgi:ribonuclease P protein component
VLPAARRLRSSVQFRCVLRQGRRVGRRDVVVHLLAEAQAPTQPGRVGLIVGRAVGGSVARHRVARRLRAQLAHRMDLVPGGANVVVRARPSAAQAASGDLGAQLDSALRALS